LRKGVTCNLSDASSKFTQQLEDTKSSDSDSSDLLDDDDATPEQLRALDLAKKFRVFDFY
jgi:hypothetical protein